MNNIGQKTKPKAEIIQQMKDFFAYCDEDTYTYVRVYSEKELMRTFQAPYRWDIIWQVQQCIINMPYNDILYGAQPDINYYDVADMKQRIKQELVEQAMQASWSKNPDNIDALDIERIREDYISYLREQRSTEKEMSEVFKQSNDPYHHLNAHH